MRLEDITLMTNKIKYVVLEDFWKIKEVVYKFNGIDFTDWQKGNIKHRLLLDLNNKTEIMQVIIDNDTIYCELEENKKNEH